MFIQENFLNTAKLAELKILVDNEIESFLCKDAPPYQSFNYMHIKHADNLTLKELLDKATRTASNFLNKNLSIHKCWFNVAKENSSFGFHQHPYTLSSVFFLEGCNNYGTLFRINNVTLQLLSKDNSMIFFDPKIDHSIPAWNGIDRYSIAIDFQ